MRPAGAALAKPGDALPGAALRVLRACGLPAPSQSPEHRPIGGNISAWGGPDAVRRDFLAEPDGPSWRLDRRVFEADLIAAARAAGVEARADALQDARREGEVWRLRWREGGGGTARWLIDATGRSAAVARKFGARRHFDEPLVAIVGHGRPHPRFAIEQSLVETTPDGWWYAALLPDRRPVFMLHTRPGSRVSPDLWRARLAATRHIAQAFPYVRFEDRLRGYDARGGWLAPVHGDGWIACGDAALSFDPSAAQGLFSALYLGMAAADATHAALRGDRAAVSAYAAQCMDVRTIYRRRVQAHYAEERRWPEADFWRTGARDRQPAANTDDAAIPAPARSQTISL
jgi:flavin-dependent dehydrogenase